MELISPNSRKNILLVPSGFPEIPKLVEAFSSREKAAYPLSRPILNILTIHSLTSIEVNVMCVSHDVNGFDERCGKGGGSQ